MSSSRRAPIGLPSNPRSSPRLAGPVAPNNHAEHRRAASSQLPSRPINSSMRRDPRPFAKMDNRIDGNESVYPSHQRNDQQLEIGNPRLSGGSFTTSSSSSSETSSFWARGNHSRASSRTTVRSDEDLNEQYSELKQENRPNNSQIVTSSHTESGYVWNRVTEVANVLTQEVTRVWAAGLGTADVTSEEDDSHLTRVMRAYHLSKARTPSELPDWLFSARERGLGQGRFESHSHNDQERSSVAQNAEQERYKRADTYHPDPHTRTGMRTKNMNNLAENTTPIVGQAKLSGTDRLKQMRSLRQNVSVPSNRF